MLISNATVTLNHTDGTTEKGVRISIQPSSDEQIAISGGIVSYDIHFRSTQRVYQGDRMTVTKFDGHPYPDEVATVVLGNPRHIPGLLPHIVVTVSGVYL